MTPEVGTKRKREEDATSGAISTGESSPKKVKTEWDGPVSEELTRKKQEVEAAARTDEDATKFLENMTEMLARAGEVPPEVTDTLEQILNGLSASNGNPFVDGFTRSSSPDNNNAADSFLQFFDFTSFNNGEDPGSKANTPDLVQTSSTNPSPGSGSDLEGSHGSSSASDNVHIADPKGDDDAEGSDPLRMSYWKEIGGVEAATYNMDAWKWEGPMPTLEQPWAISDR